MDKKRLDLKFRPDDVFAKPIYGDLKPASGLLIKVVYRRRRHDIPGPSTEEDDTNDEPKIHVLGVVRSMFKFEGKKTTCLSDLHTHGEQIFAFACGIV